MSSTTPPILLPLFSLTNKTPEQLFNIAESGPAGFYPVGVNRFWHGGIHLHGSEPVRALWDGEIVAYRVSHKHLTGTIDDKEQTFSNSFVLLRHTYETPKGAQIKFHSLYMHLLPLGEYSAAQLAKAPSIFHQKRYTVKSAADYALALCDLTNSHIVLGYIPHGSTFEASSDPVQGTWHRVSFNGIEGCVDFKKNARVHRTSPRANSYTATPTKANTSATEQGLNLRDAASKGKIVGFAPNGTVLRFKDPAAHGDKFLDKPTYRELEAGGVFIHASKETVSANDIVAPIQYDSVVNLNPPLKVKAGELLGYAGPYCNREAVAHVEIFTDTINFLDNPKQETWGKKDGEPNAYTWPDFKRFEENVLSVNGFVDKAKFQLFNYGEDGVVDNSALLNEVDTNKDGNISINEIRDSVKQLRLHVCRHPTEWSATGLDTKFARLKGEPWKLKENYYQQQLDHIRKLTFWEQVTQKPASSTVWHLHPVAFVAHLKSLRGITKEQLRAIMRYPEYPNFNKAVDEAVDKYLLHLNEAMEKYGINENRLRQCHFLAQLGIESKHLRDTAEDYNGNNPEQYFNDLYKPESPKGRRLGNTEDGDGYRFFGRGLIQLTGRPNYTNFSQEISDPTILTDEGASKVATSPVLSCSAAGFFWHMRNINEDADNDDVAAVTKKVQGANGHLAERTRLLNKSKQVLLD